ncbi:uncharacterized protein DNG_00849 [Cephalotrichum gorgonifer]|uniref:Uncharacterized protein n=1 Tax=Cephalotrichum gorgonifer TaxID=2041049 RepID=A0AAE8MRJ8_9PEZI|nr:uncharacterized protein DNG_00849 [Cephalotrichum gorgonifer]
MAPPAPITYGKKGRKGVKLVASLSSARLRDDGDFSKRRLPKSISSADICHPHLNHYTPFGPIEEASGIGHGVGPARYTKDSQTGRKNTSTPGEARFGLDVRAVREETEGHDAAARARRTLKGPGQHDSPGQRSHTPRRGLPHSKTSDLDFLNPRPAPLPRSKTTALPSIPIRVDPPVQTSTRAPYHDPEAINSKVAAMLAATEMLKPKEPQGAKKPATKGKVLSKVAGLFDRLHSKKSGIGSDKNIDSCSTPSRNGLIPATNTECQHNENQKPRTWKPQRLIEHKIPRKPVPNGGMHLQAQTPQTQTPPSTLGATTHPPLASTKEVILDLPTPERENDVDISPEGGNMREAGKHVEPQTNTALVDPFESEKDFSNVEGFLTAEPIAASTPRRQVQVTKERIVGESPLQTRLNPPGRLSYPSVNDADDELTDPGIRVPPSRPKLGKRPAKPVIRLQRGSTNVVFDVDNIEPKRMKKHPTPSKASLDELSRQFVALVPHLHDQDELSMGVAGVSPRAATFPRAAPRHSVSKTPILTTTEYHALIRSNVQPSMPTTPTEKPVVAAAPSAWRLPFARGVKKAREEHQTSRLVPSGGSHVQPAQPHTGDVDELQWDEETCRQKLLWK